MIFFLAFLLRIVHFGTVVGQLALAEMAGGVAVGGFIGTAIGSALRARATQVMIFGMLAVTMVVTALCAAYFGLWAAVIVAFAAAFGQTLVKLALDSTVQREIKDDVRSSTFAASETLHQLSWVAGGLLGLAMSLTASGVIGLTVAAVCLALSLTAMLRSRRRRIRLANQMVRPPDRPGRRPGAGQPARSGVYVVGHGAQHSARSSSHPGCPGASAAVRVRHPVEQLDQVLDETRSSRRGPSGSILATVGGGSSVRTCSAWAPLRPSATPNSTR